MLKRFMAAVSALVLTLSLAAPAGAWNNGGGDYEWQYGLPNDTDVPVCAAENFDREVGDGWDYSIARHDAVRDTIAEFNALGLTLQYYMSNLRCSEQPGNRLEIRWVGGSGAPDNPEGIPSVMYWNTLDKIFGCLSHCLKVAQIVVDTDADIQALGWPYLNDTWKVTTGVDIPANKIAFRAVFLHELGHASGLRHSNVNNSIMCSDQSASNCYHADEMVGPTTSDFTYDPDDIAGFCGPPWDDDPNKPGNMC